MLRKLSFVWLLLLSTFAATAIACQEPKPEVRSNPERPPSADILPENTVVYLQIHNVREFVERMDETSFGKLMAEEKLKKLVDELYGEVKNQYEKVRDQVGVSLDELTELVTGELVFAVAAFKDRNPGVVLMFDYDPQAETLNTLMNSGRKFVESEGATLETLTESDVEIQKMRADEQDFFFFKQNGTFVGATDLELVKEMLARWRGETVEKIRPLSQNRKFITIMNRCRGTKDAPPELRGYVDPIELSKALTRGNFGARVVINSLQIVGLDGFLAAGGSVIYAEDGYESITHGHVLLANPRAGILEMAAFRPGDLTPESWVSDETISYVSWNWDVDRMYTELDKMVNAFQGEGAFEKLIEDNINKHIELKLKEDLLSALTGRVTYTSWYEKPIKFNSQTNAIAFELKDAKKFEETLDKLIAKLMEMRGPPGDDAEPLDPREDYRGVTCWKFENLDGRQSPGDEDESDEESDEDRLRRVSIRTSFPNAALIDNHLVITDSRAFIEKAIDTYKEEAPALKDDAEFSRVSRHMKRLLGTSVPGAVIYNRPDRSMELLYDMFHSDAAKEFMNMGAEEDEVFARFKKVLDDNQLPAFEDLRGYFAPTGMFLTSDETGMHFLGFQLKTDDDR